jgi:hypothetical protein
MSSDEIEDVSDHFQHPRHTGDSSGSGRFFTARASSTSLQHHRRHSGAHATLSAMLAAARADAQRKVSTVRTVSVPAAIDAVERTPSGRWAHAASQGDADSDFGLPATLVPLPKTTATSAPVVVVVHDDDDDDDDKSRVVAHSDSSGWISAPRSGRVVDSVTVLSSSSPSSSSSHKASPANRQLRGAATPYTQTASVRRRAARAVVEASASPFATPPRGELPFDAIGSPSPEQPIKRRVIAVDVGDDDAVVDDDDDDDNAVASALDKISAQESHTSSKLGGRAAIVGDDIEDVSDAALELKARSHPRASQQALFGARAKLPVLADAGVVRDAEPTPMRRAQRSHAERVASASLCTDARVLFWSHSSMAAVERAACDEHSAHAVEALGSHRRVATYARHVDVCNAVLVEIAVADGELLCTLVSAAVRCQLAVPLAVDEAIRAQLYSLQAEARNANWRRLECGSAQLVTDDGKPYLLYCVSWCDASAVVA